MKIFIGRYYHRLEAKGRVSLPKPFREQQDRWVISRGLDGGLFLFPEEDFQLQLAQLAKKSFTQQANREFVRLMANDAKIVIADKLGRVHLPEYLIEFAKLTADLVLVGSFNRVEIWDRELYHQYLEKIEPRAEAIAQSINEQNTN